MVTSWTENKVDQALPAPFVTNFPGDLITNREEHCGVIITVQILTLGWLLGYNTSDCMTTHFILKLLWFLPACSES